jgi:predicted nucleotidyltransferase component of viral defense system
MTPPDWVLLPPLPSPATLADLCRDVAAHERLAPAGIEKDFYLTRALWALGQVFQGELLLKGGTLLSKVDLGFRRLSEDMDLVIPGEPGRTKRDNAVRMNHVRNVLRELAPIIGIRIPYVHGERSDRDAHCLWDAEYTPEFGPQGIRVEASIRPVALPIRKVGLRQLRSAKELGYEGAFSWALHADEARAEKVRAACTRDAIRDFYDLDRYLFDGADFTSPKFLGLVDAKLGEIGAPKMKEQLNVFDLTGARLRLLEASLKRELPSVVRVGEPSFDLPGLLSWFAAIWKKAVPAG